MVILGKFGYLQVQSLSYALYHTKDVEIVLLNHIEDVFDKFGGVKNVCVISGTVVNTTNMFRCFLEHDCCNAHNC